LVQLQQHRKEIEAAGGQLVAISYDSAEVLKRFAAQSGISYPLVSDPGSGTIDAYGIRNREAPERLKGIPHPGTFVVDRGGVIRAKLFLEGYRDRHAIEPLLEALKSAK
jgi:peroxiredoxin